MSDFDRTLEYIELIQAAVTPLEVCDRLLSITRDFGLTSLMAGTVPDPGTPAKSQTDHVLLCDWPHEWLGLYVERNHVDHDPLVSFMKNRPAPVRWMEAADAICADARGRQVDGDAGAFDLRDGLAFPLFTLDGGVMMVSLGGTEVEMSPREFGMISLAATYAIGRAMQLGARARSSGNRVGLTNRERECMQWAALGKSEWEISQILGISEHTSEKHLLNAKAKLGAVNRVQAVAEAIRLGYIS